MIQHDHTIPERMEAIRPLLIGANIPVVTARTSANEILDLNAVVSARRTLLVFYRGGWCGFCQKQLVELRQAHQTFETLDFQVIAISPDTPANVADTVEKYRLPFTVLSDTGMQSAIDFGIAWRVSDRDDEYYEKLRRASGETHRILPVPACFIVDTEEIIQFEYVNPNYRQRPTIALLLAAAQD